MHQRILRLLSELIPGPVPQDRTQVILQELAAIWGELEGGGEASMSSEKVGRAEDLRWHPPVLSFVIERHGGTVLGSSRAEMQAWSVDLDAMSADWGASGFRQLRPMSPPWTRADAQIAAEQAAQAIREGRDEPYLRWSRDRQSVQITAAGRLFPDGPKETVTARSRSFSAALTKVLDGWERRGNWWRRQG